MRGFRVALVLLSGCIAGGAALGSSAAAQAYDTVGELWSGFDPRRDPLEPEILAEKNVDGIVVRTVAYSAETVDGFKVRIVAYYGFPASGKALPAILHVHGGGQNAILDYVVYWGHRGYATLSINWGGRPLEGKPGNPRTEWGPLRFNQDPKDSDHLYTTKPNARANSWFHWAIAARRGVTFLERQPEVDPNRIGEFGISMGGMLTWLIAGTDTRLKCAADVFGLELLYEPLPGIPGSEYAAELKGNDVWPRVLDPIAYAPRIRTPFLFLSATNDVHARLDMVDRTLKAIPGTNVWRTFSLHISHCSTPREAPTLAMWMDRWLKNGSPWPRSPSLAVDLNGKDQVPHAMVTVDNAASVREVLVHYSVDPYPAARFWRTATTHQVNGQWTADLPVLGTDRPIYAFADLAYDSGLVIASPLALVSPKALEAARIVPTEKHRELVDDFAAGPRDWYNPEGGANVLLGERDFFERTGHGVTWKAPLRNGWRIFTRKISDPEWSPAEGSALAITLQAERPNAVTVVVVKDDGRPPKRACFYFATVHLTGGGTPERLLFSAHDFHAVEDGSAMEDWTAADVLGIASRYVVSGKNSHRPDRELGGPWAGPPPILSRVEWTASSQ